MSKRKPDVIDFVSRKTAAALIETAKVVDQMEEPFRSGGICALEEFWFRLIGSHFDWEEVKIQLGRRASDVE